MWGLWLYARVVFLLLCVDLKSKGLLLLYARCELPIHFAFENNRATNIFAFERDLSVRIIMDDNPNLSEWMDSMHPSQVFLHLRVILSVRIIMDDNPNLSEWMDAWSC